MKSLLTILSIYFSHILYAQCSHNVVTLSLTDFTAKEAYYPNGNTLGLHGGDTLKIPVLAAGAVYSLIQLDSLAGYQGCPINIVPSGGQVLFTQIRFGQNHITRYVHITGTYTSGIYYGFRGGVLTTSLVDHLEVDHFENSDQQNGFFFHVNPSTSNWLTVYPNYVTNKYYIHDNYIHNTHGEGMYIMHTYPNGDPYSGDLVPIRGDSVEIAFNTVDGTDWDGIQLSNAQDGCSIHDNVVKNFGLIDMGGQRAGIILGANSNGKVYNNTVRDGTGNGIQIFGYGFCDTYNNVVEHVGNTLDDGCSGCQGEQSFFTKAAINIETRPKQVISIRSNIINAPRPRGILTTNNDANYSDSVYFTNNQICFNGSIPGSWQTTYIGIAQVNKVVTGNTATVCPTVFYFNMPRMRKLKN
jgi:hypothetical protein